MAGETKTCCFFGHRKISKTEELERKLYEVIEKLILHNNVEKFLFGSKSDFNTLCRTVVTKLKEKHPHIQRVYVRAEFPYIDEDYKQFLLENYEDTYFPERAINAGRAVYIERNCEMIDNSDYCITYYTQDYVAPARKSSKKDLVCYQPKSGTKTAYEYAMRKKRKIINIAD